MFWALRKTPNYEATVLEGERVLLRPLLVSDATEMFTFVSDPEVTHFLPWEPAKRVETVQNFLEDQIARRKRGESLGFAILEKQGAKMIGSTDLMDLRAKRGQAEIGYLLAKPYWGQGIMTEAARLSVDFGFRCMKLTCVIAWADQENLASVQVMKKLGMTYSGSETRLVKNLSRPYVQYAVERADWTMLPSEE
ncbi:MAG: GNAT family N-acetyltransferase [Armatimonadaceae bacterium]